MTKAELTKALDQALAALGYQVCLANETLLNKRRAMRLYPHADWPHGEFRMALLAHDQAKRALDWLNPAQRVAARAEAAAFLRRDLLSRRRVYPRTAPALALAA